MVTKTEETQLNQLEHQVENGGGGASEFLCLVRKLKVRRSEKVLKHGSSILNDPGKRSALGPDEWTLNEQVAIAAMDCQCLGVAQEGWREAVEAYSSLLEDNPLDQAIHKRRVAIAKALDSWLIKMLGESLQRFIFPCKCTNKQLSATNYLSLLFHCTI